MAGTTTTRQENHSFKVKSGVTEVKKAEVYSLSITTRANRIPTALLFVIDGDVAEQRFNQSDLEAFEPGKKLSIELGYQNQTRPVFEGIIVSHSIKARQGKSSMLCLELQHETVRMAQVRTSRVFKKATDSAIARQLVQQYDPKGQNLSVSWPDGQSSSSKVEHERCVQYNVSDWDFLVSRAEANGLFVYVENGQIKVRPPVVDTSSECVIEFGDNVYDFEMAFEARNQYEDIVAVRWDFEKQKFHDHEAKDSPFSGTDLGPVKTNDIGKIMSPAPKRISYNGHIKVERLTDWLNGFKMRSMLSKVRGGFVIKGRLDVKPGDTVKLDGFSRLFNGFAFVSGITHKFDPGDWRTEVEVGVSPDVFSHYNDVIDEPVSGLIPEIAGLHIGVVTDIDTMKGLHQVGVQIPQMSQEELVFARVLQSEAGDGHGSFYYPELGDEVLVGFLNNDPCNAVILGGLYSVNRTEDGKEIKKGPPFANNEEHNKRGILTPAQIRFELDDDNESVTLETPDKKTIVLDKDGILVKKGEGEYISITNSGITLETSGTITLKAKDIKLEAGGKFTAEGRTMDLHGARSSSLTSDQKTKIDGKLRIDIG